MQVVDAIYPVQAEERRCHDHDLELLRSGPGRGIDLCQRGRLANPRLDTRAGFELGVGLD